LITKEEFMEWASANPEDAEEWIEEAKHSIVRAKKEDEKKAKEKAIRDFESYMSGDVDEELKSHWNDTTKRFLFDNIRMYQRCMEVLKAYRDRNECGRLMFSPRRGKRMDTATIGGVTFKTSAFLMEVVPVVGCTQTEHVFPTFDNPLIDVYDITSMILALSKVDTSIITATQPMHMWKSNGFSVLFSYGIKNMEVADQMMESIKEIFGPYSESIKPVILGVEVTLKEMKEEKL